MTLQAPHAKTFSSTTLPNSRSGMPSWFIYGYNSVKNGNTTPPGPNTSDTEKKEWDAGVLEAIRCLGAEEFGDSSHYLSKVTGLSETKDFYNTPIVINPVTDDRVILSIKIEEGDYAVRETVLWDEEDNPNGLFKDDPFGFNGFLSVFEKDISSGEGDANNEIWKSVKASKSIEEVRRWNLGILAGEYYKKHRKIDEKIISKLKNYMDKGTTETEKGKEKIMDKTTVKSAATAAVQSTDGVLSNIKEVAKADGLIIGKRVAARQANKALKGLLIKKITSTMANKKEMAKFQANLEAAFNSPIGDGIAGLLSSLAIPELAKLFGQGGNPHIADIAHECRLEGGAAVGDMIADIAREGVGELMSVVQTAIVQTAAAPVAAEASST